MDTQPDARIEPRLDTAPLVKPQWWARLYGGLYLINIIGSSFAFGYLAALVVPGDGAATAHNIVAHELFYRVSLVAYLIAILTNIPGVLLFYELFKVVNRRLALLDVFFGLVATTVEGANLLSLFTPLLLLGGGHSPSVAFTSAQVQALASLPFGSQTIAYDIQQVFYATDFLVVGYLLFRATFVPRTLGVVLWIGALCYLTYSFADLLVPEFAAHLFPYIQIPSGLAEISLCLWFLIMGVNVFRWKQQDGQTIEPDSRIAGGVAVG